MIGIYTLYIYNDESLRLERYRLETYHDIPYTAYGSMTIPEFFGRSVSTVGWTSVSFLRSWTLFSKGNIRATNVFRRIFEGGHTAQSMHYSGLAAEHNSEKLSTAFPFSENRRVSLSPAGYPELYPRNIGPFVFVLQDALMTLGFNDITLDGFFGDRTLNALRSFKHVHKLDTNDICDLQTWRKLCHLAAGCGVTPTVSDILHSREFFCSYSDIK